MKTFLFTVKEHPEYGGKGFAPKWYPNGDPLPGMAVAHDILEHFAHDDGSAEGEMQALGACMLIRGESGYFQRNGNANSTEQHLAADFPEIWRYHTDRDNRTAVRPCGLIRNSDVMDMAREAVRLGVKELREMECDNLPTAEDCERFARWMGKGYMRAQKRYKNRVHAVAYRVFQEIEEKADKALQHAEEGMILTVRVDFINLECSLDCDYPYDPYEEY